MAFGDYWQGADPLAQGSPYLARLMAAGQPNAFGAGASQPGPQLPMGTGLSPATGYSYPTPPAMPQASQGGSNNGAGLGGLLGDVGKVLPLLGSLGGEFGLATGTDSSGGVSNIGGAGMSHTGGGSTGNQVLGTIAELAPLALMFFSDRRLKVIGEPYKSAVKDLSSLTVRQARYRWDEPGDERPMLMADEVQRRFPKAVIGKPDDLKTPQILVGAELVAALVGAVKELSERLERVERRLGETA